MTTERTLGFWGSIPGLITAVAGLLTAVATLLWTLNSIGVFKIEPPSIGMKPPGPPTINNNKAAHEDKAQDITRDNTLEDGAMTERTGGAKIGRSARPRSMNGE